MTSNFKHSITWNSIVVEITYKENYFASVGVSHLEIRAAERLPFTETGYHSLWTMKGELEAEDVVQYVKDALDYDSKSNKWKAYLKEKAIADLEKTQLSFF